MKMAPSQPGAAPLDLASLPDRESCTVAHDYHSLAELASVLVALAPVRVVIEATGGFEPLAGIMLANAGQSANRTSATWAPAPDWKTHPQRGSSATRPQFDHCPPAASLYQFRIGLNGPELPHPAR